MNPTAEIITIGDEILIGQTVDTNSAWIGGRMSKIGIPVNRIVSIPDRPEEICQAVEEAFVRAEVVLITGGLGPTSDDRTKQTLAGFFGSRLILNESVLEDIRQLLAMRHVPMNDLNRSQAMVPDNCRVIRNRSGTAPGMWFERDGRVLVSMPGVPYEMKAMMESLVLNDLKALFKTPPFIHRTVMTTGIPESQLALTLQDWEKTLPESVKLAYLPSPGIVKLRLSGYGPDPDPVLKLINGLIARLPALIPEAIFGFDETSLEETVGILLRKNGLTLSAAESCTGGYLAHLVTRIPGSSDYFKGSIIAYSNEIKTKFLDVPFEMLVEHGAVSEPVVRQMAQAARLCMDSDYALAISGIAGPAGGTPDKPVGTTWIAVAGPQGIYSSLFRLGEHRERNIRRAALAALNRLRISILKDTSR